MHTTHFDDHHPELRRRGGDGRRRRAVIIATALAIIALTFQGTLGCDSCLESGEQCKNTEECCDDLTCREYGSGQICQ